MRGYVTVLQWHAGIKHIDELMDPERHRGDAAAVDSFLGFDPPPIVTDYPGTPPIGHAVLRVEDDGGLTLVRANWDSSD